MEVALIKSDQKIEVELGCRKLTTAQVVVGIAHQLNTPIGNCLVGGSYISDETNTMLNNFNNKKISEKSLQGYLNNMVNISNSICTSLCSASDLIKKLKLLSLNEHLEDKKKFNIKELILSNVITKRLTSEHPLIDFKLTVPINLTVVSYSNAFCLTLTHLIENSITHAFEDTNKGLIEITISTTEQSLLMKYQDNGKGVEQQILDKMFTPFYTSKMAKKQGLGLSILHTLIHHKLHGELNYSSELGKGLTINIIIPLSELGVTSEYHLNVVNYDF